MLKLLKAKSLRFWILVGMIIALAPLAMSAGVGYLLLNRGVIAPIHDVAFRQSEQVGPTQHLRILIWDTLIPVDEYVEDAHPAHPEAYRRIRGRIETEFAQLDEAVADEAAKTLISRARESWTEADGHATELISTQRLPGDQNTLETMQRFHGAIVTTSDRLEAVYDQIAGKIQQDHDAAVLTYERSMWIAGIAGGLSLLALGCGVLLIGRIMSGSIDRLVAGAARFAEGDRDHRIQVQVPPELSRVAEEFNYMIGRIRQSEEALAELAHADSLTGLANRRAFDTTFKELLSRLKRFDEPCCLLTLDIDHFKSINDTYGHAAGDEVLRSVARVMARNMRSFDKIFRMGGEEFSILMPKTNVEDAREAAERLRQVIASTPVQVSGRTINLTVSLGLVAASEEADQRSMIEAADAALYDAKSSGRNRLNLSGEGGCRNQNAA